MRYVAALRRAAGIALVPLLTGLTLVRGGDQAGVRGEDIWERSRAAYAKLQSYADSGTILTESRSPGATAVVERHTFSTYYQAPRKFYFDFRKDPKAGKERLVIWCDGGDFESWWSATGVHQTYPKGTGASAFGTASFPTKGSVVLIPPLLFSQAGLQGPLTVFKPRQAATEELNGVRSTS
jgi:hypothetical protein